MSDDDNVPERIWINEPPESGRVTAYISPIREIGTCKSLSLAEYARVRSPLAPAVDDNLLPQTDYKNKPQLDGKDRYKFAHLLHEYTFNNCDHGEQAGRVCKGCVVECLAHLAQRLATASVERSDELVDEVQHRMDQVVEAAVEWHQAGQEGGDWFEAGEKLGSAINSLLELRDKTK